MIGPGETVRMLERAFKRKGEVSECFDLGKSKLLSCQAAAVSELRICESEEVRRVYVEASRFFGWTAMRFHRGGWARISGSSYCRLGPSAPRSSPLPT